MKLNCPYSLTIELRTLDPRTLGLRWLKVARASVVQKYHVGKVRLRAFFPTVPWQFAVNGEGFGLLWGEQEKAVVNVLNFDCVFHGD